MMAKPMKTLELHYPMIQFLIISDSLCRSAPPLKKIGERDVCVAASFIVFRTPSGVPRMFGTYVDWLLS